MQIFSTLKPLYKPPTPLKTFIFIFSKITQPKQKPLANREYLKMSGVWVFNNGVLRLVGNHGSDSYQGSTRRKVLIHVPSDEVITSYDVLERILSSFGWERYYDDPDLLQFHKRLTTHLISLPKDFNKLKSMHMYDIVVKNRNMFEVRDMYLN
ncbi:flowering-promoting factor 1-like [Bidens hawaiensis]|uniref:flowering-promoting factor 1-like n=1 Tax=Bidens hawaiensis TaxID=980011 RepID=UPI00404A3A09